MRNLFLLILTISFNLLAFGENLPTKNKIYDVVKKVNDHWQIANPSYGRAFWDNAAYHTGNMAAYELTGINRYKTYSTNWAELNEWMGAKSDNPDEWRYSYGESDRYVLFGDWQICFQTYIDLFNYSDPKDSSMIERTLEVMEYEMSTENTDYWWWADGLYMVMPVMTKLYKLTGNELYLEKLYAYFKYAQSIMYDEETGLFYRDGNYVYPEHQTINGLKDFWSRGDGWVFAGLAKIIQDMPSTYTHKTEFEQIFVKMAATLKTLQQDDGFWTRSLMDPEYAPGPETSGTAFFIYGFAWGINNGLLQQDDYLATVEKGWNYLQNTALQEDGSVGYVQPIGSSASPGTYVDENSTANFGVGAFLLAGTEVVNLAEGDLPAKPEVYMDSISIEDNEHLQVYFNIRLNETSATNIENYSIEGISITNARLVTGSNSVVLTTSSIELGKHFLYIRNIEDVNGNLVEDQEWMTFLRSRDYTVTASGYEPNSDNYPENTLDGDLNTRWSAFGGNEYLEYDLQKISNLKSVDIAFYKGNERQTFIDIEISEDGINFQNVLQTASSGDTCGYENFDFEDINARYVRIIGHGNSSNAWNSITEVSINYASLSTSFLYNNHNEILLYPNPYQTGSLNLTFREYLPDNSTIEFINVNGKRVLEFIIEDYKKSIQIPDLTMLDTGIYKVIVRSENNYKRLIESLIVN